MFPTLKPHSDAHTWNDDIYIPYTSETSGFSIKKHPVVAICCNRMYPVRTGCSSILEDIRFYRDDRTGCIPTEPDVPANRKTSGSVVPTEPDVYRQNRMFQPSSAWLKHPVLNHQVLSSETSGFVVVKHPVLSRRLRFCRPDRTGAFPPQRQNRMFQTTEPYASDDRTGCVAMKPDV